MQLILWPHTFWILTATIFHVSVQNRFQEAVFSRVRKPVLQTKIKQNFVFNCSIYGPEKYHFPFNCQYFIACEPDKAEHTPMFINPETQMVSAPMAMRLYECPTGTQFSYGRQDCIKNFTCPIKTGFEREQEHLERETQTRNILRRMGLTLPVLATLDEDNMKALGKAIARCSFSCLTTEEAQKLFSVLAEYNSSDQKSLEQKLTAACAQEGTRGGEGSEEQFATTFLATTNQKCKNWHRLLFGMLKKDLGEV